MYTIAELKKKIEPVAKKHGVKSVALFGSYSRGEAGDSSDVDLLIEKGKVRTLFQLTDFRMDMESALNLPVDVITSENPDKNFLSMIHNDEVLLYECA